MLILTRRIGETLIINDNIIVNILGITGGQVRIGIDAPKEISIHREEIAERIKACAKAPLDFDRVTIGERVTTDHGPAEIIKKRESNKTVQVKMKNGLKTWLAIHKIKPAMKKKAA